MHCFIGNRPDFQHICPNGKQVSWFHHNETISVRPELIFMSDADFRSIFMNTQSSVVPDTLMESSLNLKTCYIQ
jgi:hypothetical protein